MSIANSALEMVNARAAVDRDFRGRLLENPKDAIREATGIDIPRDVGIKFIEKDPSLDALLVLPDLMDTEAELNAEELEAVAGGAEEAAWCDKICITNTTNTLSSEAAL